MLSKYCNWKLSSLAGSYCQNMRGPRQESNGPAGTGDQSGMPATDCAQAAIFVEVCTGMMATGLRMGPFNSHPGQWHFFWTEALQSLLLPGKCITQYGGKVIHADTKEPIGFPPIHMHHLHIQLMRDKGGWDGSQSHWWETHGDFSNGPDWGIGALSTEGYNKHVTSGYCVTVGEETKIAWAVLNDVRIVEGNDKLNKSLPCFLEVVFGLSSPNVTYKAASLFWLNNPWHNGDVYGRYLVGSSEEVLWWSGHIPIDGETLANPWLHTHRARYLGMLLFSENADNILYQVGGCSSLRISTFPTPYTHIAEKGATHSYRILKKVNRSLICADFSEAPSAIHIGGSDGIPDGFYDRTFSAVRCQRWEFKAGSQFSVFAFHAPRWSMSTKDFPMHFNLFFWVDAFDEISHDATLNPAISRYAPQRFGLCPSPLSHPSGNPGNFYFGHRIVWSSLLTCFFVLCLLVSCLRHTHAQKYTGVPMSSLTSTSAAPSFLHDLAMAIDEFI